MALMFRIAAVSGITILYSSSGIKMGLGLTGKLGRAWVRAWVVHG